VAPGPGEATPRLIIKTFSVGALGCNCTIVACPETHEGIVVDPGDEAPRILRELRALGVTAVTLVHTHAHFDHVMGSQEIAAHTDAETAVHREDRWLWDNVEMQAQLFGLSAGPTVKPARELLGGETLAFGRRSARVLHTPGHTPGSLCLFIERSGERPLLFAGDTLFAGSVGRTDLWGGSFEQLARSIRGDLFALPDDTLVIAGHGPETTILAEREHNPIVGKFAR
jgi:glyoxylase-like metal-dependent hydrolase (beta-lactamase superfamily II)